MWWVVTDLFSCIQKGLKPDEPFLLHVPAAYGQTLGQGQDHTESHKGLECAGTQTRRQGRQGGVDVGFPDDLVIGLIQGADDLVFYDQGDGQDVADAFGCF